MKILKKKLSKLFITFFVITNIIFLSKTFSAGEQNANGKFFYEYTPITGGMYCQINGKVRSTSNIATIDGTSIRTIQSFNPIFLYNYNTTTGFSISFEHLKNTLYHPVNSYRTVWPQANSGDRKASMLAGYFVSGKIPGTYEVANYTARPRYGTNPVVTGIILKFFVDKTDDSNDSNIPVSVNGRDILFSGPDLKINLVPKPCIPDNKPPEISITSIGNNSYRVPSNTIISFFAEDKNGQKYNFNPIGLGLGTFSFKSTNQNDISTGNYDFDSDMDNQYGINSGSLFFKILGSSYIHDYYKNDVDTYGQTYRNGLKNRKFENIKGYTGYFYAKSGWDIEEEITIFFSGSDTSPDGPNNSQFSITFNSPKQFEIENLNPGNNAQNTNPELTNISLSVYDDWAGVNSGSLIITIRTGGINGSILKTFSGIDLNLISYEKFFPADGLGSISITGNYNYAISLTGVGPLPENTLIYVVISGYDLAPTPTPSKKYFSFTTRKSCYALQCGQGVVISTGTRGTGIFYTSQILNISGGNFPFLSGNQIVCSSAGYSGFDIYTGGTKIDYGVSTGGFLFSHYLSSGLKIVVSGGTATLVGNTLYVVASTPTTTGGIIPGPGGTAGGGGGGGFYKDNCCIKIYGNSLPGANSQCIDYSVSYYDGKCYASSEDYHYIDECRATEMECAYDYCFAIGSTTMPTFQSANVTGYIYRRHMAKIISEFAIKILGKKPDSTRNCNFQDISKESKELQFYIKLSCQLGIMGLLNDKQGSPNTIFNPQNKVTRAQFGTIISRTLFGMTFNSGTVWYQPHLVALNKYGIIKDISNAEKRIETRGNAFIMLRRIGILVNRYGYQTNEIFKTLKYYQNENF